MRSNDDSPRDANLHLRRAVLALVFATPITAFAQAAGSPFEAGGNSLAVFAQTIGTPIATLIQIGIIAKSMFVWSCNL